VNKAKNTLLLVSILTMLSVWGFVAVYHAGYIPKGLDLFIFALIMISGLYAFVTNMKRYKDEQEGFPAEDELSLRIKYRAGYYAFVASMYIWLFIFLFKDFFPDIETMLGGGVLTSAFLAMGIRGYLTRHYNENAD